MMFTMIFSLCIGMLIAYYMHRRGIDLSDLIVGIYRCIRAQIKYLRFGKEVPTEELAKRLTICGSCPFENNGVCMQCGCILAEKARMSTEQCPNNYWTDSEKK
jgi:hypothetical protein